MVSLGRAENPRQAFCDRWNSSCSRRSLLAFHRCLPNCEAHLDARLDSFQRRRLLPVSRRILLDHRREGLSPLVVPTGSGWHELNRSLPDCSSLGRLHRGESAHQSRIPGLSNIWNRPGTVDGWHHGHVDLLAHLVLDVSEKAVPPHLKPENSSILVGPEGFEPPTKGL